MWDNKLPIEKVIEAYKYCNDDDDIISCNDCPLYPFNKNCKDTMDKNIIGYLEEYYNILHKEKVDRYAFWRKEYGK